MLKQFMMYISTWVLVLTTQSTSAATLVGKLVETKVNAIEGNEVIYDALHLTQPYTFNNEDGVKSTTQIMQLIYSDVNQKLKHTAKNQKNAQVSVNCKHLLTGDSPNHYEGYLCLVDKIQWLKP